MLVLLNGIAMPASRAADGVSVGSGREVPCTPGVDSGCLPTPAECALGGLYNGHFDGGVADRFADCVGGGGHIVHYVGGYLATGGDHQPCGAVIDADQVVAGGWTDPNMCAPASAPPGYGVVGRALPPLVRSTGGVVASDSPVAAQVGVDVLDHGGNAVDAAVATVFALGVTRPDVCGLGGVGALVYRAPHGPTAALDFIATAPTSVHTDFWQDRPPGIDTSGTGHRVVGVPGVVAGLASALRRFGTISLANAISRAETLADGGTPVEPELPGASAAIFSGTPAPLVGIPRVRMFPETANTYLRDGVLQYPPDNALSRSSIRQPDLARSLRLIADHGIDAFYTDTTYPEGPSIGHFLLSDMQHASSAPMYPGDAPVTWQASDLANYEAIWRTPLSTTYHGYKVDTIGGGTAGGYIVTEELNILEGFPLGTSIVHSSADHFHVMAEAAKLAQRDSYTYVADPAYISVPVDTLTSKDFATQRRGLIDMTRAQDYDAGSIPGSASTAVATEAARARSTHTTNVSVIDRAGGAVAVTCSLGNYFGSAVVAPGTGFALNDALVNFNAPGNVNEPAGGKRALWALSPTIVSKAGVAVLATGAAGGQLIPGAVVASISNTIDFGMDLAHALDAARAIELCAVTCPADGSDPGMFIEEGRVLPNVIADLKTERHHDLVQQGEYGFLPIVQAVGTDLLTGWHVGASDPRPGGDRGTKAQR